MVIKIGMIYISNKGHLAHGINRYLDDEPNDELDDADESAADQEPAQRQRTRVRPFLGAESVNARLFYHSTGNNYYRRKLYSTTKFLIHR